LRGGSAETSPTDSSKALIDQWIRVKWKPVQ
jgi:hypothetical protein